MNAISEKATQRVNRYMSEQIEAEEESGLEEFAKVALRRSMRGSWESLLSQHLVQA